LVFLETIKPPLSDPYGFACMFKAKNLSLKRMNELMEADGSHRWLVEAGMSALRILIWFTFLDFFLLGHGTISFSWVFHSNFSNSCSHWFTKFIYLFVYFAGLDGPQHFDDRRYILRALRQRYNHKYVELLTKKYGVQLTPRRGSVVSVGWEWVSECERVKKKQGFLLFLNLILFQSNRRSHLFHSLFSLGCSEQ
jgi:hypothetical protein